jgi:hypothetical protein
MGFLRCEYIINRTFLSNFSIFNLSFMYILSHLSENPYICDCSMVWFLREPPLQKETIKDLHEMRCSYPNKVYRKKITELKEKEICDTSKRSFLLIPKFTATDCHSF